MMELLVNVDVRDKDPITRNSTGTYLHNFIQDSIATIEFDLLVNATKTINEPFTVLCVSTNSKVKLTILRTTNIDLNVNNSFLMDDSGNGFTIENTGDSTAHVEICYSYKASS